VKRFGEKLVGLMLLLVLFVPLYSWMVQAVSGVGTRDLVESFSLMGSGGITPSSIFHVGETLNAVAASGLADTYELTVYERSFAVLVERGAFSGGEAQVDVVLSPSRFGVNHTYLVVLNAYSFNDPLPGVYFSDSVSLAFAVVRASTRLKLEARHDSAVGNLHVSANLADAEGVYSVANETVEFSLRRTNTRRITEGWLPLGMGRTDANGNAELNVAFGPPNGNYTVRARHKATESYADSSNVTNVNALFNASIVANIARNLNLKGDFGGSFVAETILILQFNLNML